MITGTLPRRAFRSECVGRYPADANTSRTNIRLKLTTAAAEQTRQEVLGYFENHRHAMDYAHYAKEGLPLGSGAVEGGCRLIGARTNGCGRCFGIQARLGEYAWERCATVEAAVEIHRQLIHGMNRLPHFAYRHRLKRRSNLGSGCSSICYGSAILSKANPAQSEKRRGVLAASDCDFVLDRSWSKAENLGAGPPRYWGSVLT